ncbi:uncharacterized protein VP01_4791g1, partial [Puccinia sorghi]
MAYSTVDYNPRDETLPRKLNQLPAVDMQHDPAKLPSKLDLYACVDVLAQSHILQSHTVCTVTVHQSLVESLLEKGWSSNRSFLGVSAWQLQAAAFKVSFKDSNNNSSSDTGSKVEELVLALIAIKKNRYLAKRLKLETAPEITNYPFQLNTGV